jgi:cytochrome c5
VSTNQDSAFLSTFRGVLLGLIALTLLIVVFVSFVGSGAQKQSDIEREKIAARLAPIGKVVTDPSVLAKATAAAAPREALSGEQVYATVCSACHTGGLLGAPKADDKAAWASRKSAAGGLDGLVASALKGKNSMPARGGKADLSEDEVKAAITFILQKNGA